MVDGNARTRTGLLGRRGDLPCSLPLWIRLIPDSWGEDVRRPHRQPSHHRNTGLWGQGLLGMQMGVTALQLLFLEASTRPRLGSRMASSHTSRPDLLLLTSLPLEPTHVLGLPTPFLPGELLWPHPQGSGVGKRQIGS